MSQETAQQPPKTRRSWIWTLATVWLFVALAYVVWDAFNGDFGAHWLARIYFWATVLFSLAAFVLYGWDKRQARRDGRRIPEKTLHRLALAGGWPGAVLGQQFFRHKTQKFSFRLKAGVILCVHFLVVLYAMRAFLLNWL